ncbi:MAG: hypothetical protein ACI8XB_000798 [Patiriisocius sp.]|jgi:hypothetical protein
MNTLYDRNGKAVAYVHDDEKHVYLYDGKPVAFLREEHLYSFSGKYLGWIYNDWFYDRDGRPAFFTQDSTGGPSRPARKAKPARSSRQARPAKGAREARPAKPTRSLNWSDLSNDNYFNQ